jgi:transcriptional antiterminator NusG
MGGALIDGAERVMSKKWYVVHAYSGFEKSVQRALIDRVARAGMQDQFGQILVPVEEVVEMKSGQKIFRSASFFPGTCSLKWK